MHHYQKALTLDYKTISVADFFAPLMALYNTDVSSQFTVKLHSKTECIEGDSSFLAQVFINLLKNAKEAGASQASIKISIQSSTSVSKQQTSRQQSNAKTILIEMIDNGHGFSNLANLFVPLYSTKEQGQGIGLSFCRNIIEQHQGYISLVNNVSLRVGEQGVTVSIYLPIKNL